MLTINIGGKERQASMRMLAVREFRRLTGKNIAGGKLTFLDLIGGEEIDPESFVQLLYSVLLDGMYPQKPDFTLDDVSSWISVHNLRPLADQLLELWLTDLTGKTKEELVNEYEKNRQAPESGANSNGETLSESLTAV